VDVRLEHVGHGNPAIGGRRPVIAVIGGGASGTLTAIHLLRLAAAGRPPVRIALIDAGGRHGLGQAYSTTHPGHLLNSPAGTMGAVAGDPGQLLRWATANRPARPPTSPPPATRCCASCSAAGWPGRTRCGSASTPAPAARCSTRPAGRAAPCSRSARRCAG
jgi:hypothetical protein